MTRQCFVNGIIDDFENHVVQAAAVIGVADVHTWSLSHRVKTL
jgi:hypothetical protein